MPPDQMVAAVDALWDQVRPLYEQLHWSAQLRFIRFCLLLFVIYCLLIIRCSYVRSKLVSKWGSNRVDPGALVVVLTCSCCLDCAFLLLLCCAVSCIDVALCRRNDPGTFAGQYVGSGLGCHLPFGLLSFSYLPKQLASFFVLLFQVVPYPNEPAIDVTAALQQQVSI